MLIGCSHADVYTQLPMKHRDMFKTRGKKSTNISSLDQHTKCPVHGYCGTVHKKCQMEGCDTIVDSWQRRACIEHACVVCTNVAFMQCKRCHNVKYCNKTCQRAHWPIHKHLCTFQLRDRVLTLACMKKDGQTILDSLILRRIYNILVYNNERSTDVVTDYTHMSALANILSSMEFCIGNTPIERYDVAT